MAGEASGQSAPYILVVDDERMNREMLETYLTMAGYRVGLANSGERALSMVASQPPDLVMLDVHLEGMDGFEVCRYLRAGEPTRDTPVLMLTAFESNEDKRQAVEVGATGFVIKPYDVQALLAQVAALLRDQ